MNSKFALFAAAILAASAVPALAADVASLTFKFDGLSTLDTRACITAEPTSCTSTIRANVEGCVLPLVEVNVESIVEYSDHGRNDSFRFTRQWTGAQCAVEIVENYNGMFLGGKITTNVAVKASNGQTGGKQDIQFFIGTNPENKTVRDVIANLTYSVVAFDRSQFKQFATDGQPAFKDGFGVFALNAPNAEQVWNWRMNVAQGVMDINAQWAKAKAYPAKMRQTGFPRLPDFTDRELKLFALQSLVGELYFVPNEGKRQWIPNRQRSNYADRLVKIEKDVAEGRPPQGW